MPSYRELLDSGSETLLEKSDTPRIDAEMLLQHLLGQSLAWLIAHGEREASAEHSKHFFELVKQRFDGRPVAYILGYRDFWTLRLQVNENVLIPRPDTETLVEQALTCLTSCESQNILDLGTGSGAIALAIAKERPKCSILAADKSDAALNVARQNALSNKIENVRFVDSDWFSAIDAEMRFDLIASNPPYVETGDAHLKQLMFEPNIALLSDEKGLGDLRRIIETSRHYLVDGGHIVLEHGFNQQELVGQLLSNNGYQDVRYFKDINQLPRCTTARWPH